MQDYDEAEDQEFLLELAKRQSNRYDDVNWDEDLVVIEEPPGVDLQMLVQNGHWRDALGSIRRALARLQYVVPATDSNRLDKDTALAVYQFQKSQKNLKVDKIPGGQTQRELLERLKDFRLH
jgi:hypothetical protein